MRNIEWLVLVWSMLSAILAATVCQILYAE